MTDQQREYFLSKKSAPPLDEQGVHDAVFGAFRSALKMQANENLPILTSETLTIWREISALRKLAQAMYWWLVGGVCAVVSIAIKVWFF